MKNLIPNNSTSVLLPTGRTVLNVRRQAVLQTNPAVHRVLAVNPIVTEEHIAGAHDR